MVAKASQGWECLARPDSKFPTVRTICVQFLAFNSSFFSPSNRNYPIDPRNFVHLIKPHQTSVRKPKQSCSDQLHLLQITKHCIVQFLQYVRSHMHFGSFGGTPSIVLDTILRVLLFYLYSCLCDIFAYEL